VLATLAAQPPNRRPDRCRKRGLVADAW